MEIWIFNFDKYWLRTTTLGLFYAKKLENSVHCLVLITFFVVISEGNFLYIVLSNMNIFRQIHLTNKNIRNYVQNININVQLTEFFNL